MIASSRKRASVKQSRVNRVAASPYEMKRMWVFACDLPRVWLCCTELLVSITLHHPTR